VVLQPGFGEAAVAGSAQAERLDALGDGALDAGAVSVAAAPVVGVLFGAGLLKNLVLDLRPQGQVATGFGVGAGGSQFTGAAGPFSETDTGDRGAAVAPGVSPLNAGAAAGAGCLTLVPVDGGSRR